MGAYVENERGTLFSLVYVPIALVCFIVSDLTRGPDLCLQLNWRQLLGGLFPSVPEEDETVLVHNPAYMRKLGRIITLFEPRYVRVLSERKSPSCKSCSKVQGRKRLESLESPPNSKSELKEEEGWKSDEGEM